jgi:hypothetical protein
LPDFWFVLAAITNLGQDTDRLARQIQSGHNDLTRFRDLSLIRVACRARSPGGVAAPRSVHTMTKAVSTIVITTEHLICADVETAGRRLLEVVSDRSTDFLRVHKAVIHRRDCNALVAEASNAVIPKSALALLVPVITHHEAPQKRYDNLIAKKEFDAFLIVLGTEVFGKLHLGGCDDPVVALSNELSGFFSISDAAVCFRFGGDEHETLPVVIANSAFVSFLHIGQFSRPATKRPAPFSDGVVPCSTPTLFPPSCHEPA